MLKNYFKVAIRNILKQKGYSFINIVGLTIGFTSCLLITLWILDELSYDSFHNDSDRIYCIQVNDGSESTPNLLAPTLANEIPEIEYACRFDWLDAPLVSSGRDTAFKWVAAVDPSFFDVFTFPFIAGDPKTALNDINSIVISKKIADRFFPNENAVGKFLTFNNEQEMRVTGVIEDVPHNSTLRFSLLVPFEFKIKFHKLRGEDYASWGWWSTSSYVKVHEGISLNDLNFKIKGFLRQHRSDSDNDVWGTPITDMHSIYTNIKGYIYSFSMVAAFILFMACINFINLSIARSAHRAKETGVRKVIGSSRLSLISQFLGESLLFIIIGMGLALVILEIILPAFNEEMGLKLSADLLLSSSILPVFIAITLLTGIFAGFYPAFYLSAFQPIKVLKTGLISGSKGSKLRRFLLIVQFVTSIFLIIGTLTVFSQLNYIRNKDIGYDKDQVLHVYLIGPDANQYNNFRSELLKNPNIVSVSGSANGMPYWRWSTQSVDWPGRDPNSENEVAMNMVDFDFTETYGIEIIEGRSFDRTIVSDSVSAYLVNEEVVKMMGLENAIGEELSIWKNPGRIIGVMKNFHFRPLNTSIQPLAFIINQQKIGTVAIRVSGGDIPSSLEHIEKSWKKIFPSFPITYAFLDQLFDRQYNKIERIGNLGGGFAVLAVVIACLGLFGLSSFATEQRTKEIGIRKVLGASVISIVKLLSSEFILLVTAANILAWPIAWYLMNKWLEEFAYRINLNITSFIIAGGIALVITILATSYHGISTALINPVKSLKNE